MTTGRALIIGGSLGGMFAAHLLRSPAGASMCSSAAPRTSPGAARGSARTRRCARSCAGSASTPRRRRASSIPRYVWLDKHGGVVADVPRPRMMTAWSRLYRPLKDAAAGRALSSGEIASLRVEQDERGITAIFADGTRETGDILVGADGSRSAVRAQLAPDAKTEYAGYIAWRALIAGGGSAPKRSASCFTRAMRSAFRTASSAVSYPVPARDGDITPGKRDYNIVWYRPADEAALADLNTDEKGAGTSRFRRR